MSKESALALLKGTPTPTPAVAPTGAPPVAATPTAPVTPPADPAVPPTETPPDDRLGLLIKKEAKIFEEREALKREKEELLKEREQYQQYNKKAKDFEELASKDKIAALKMLGWSDTDIFNHMTKEPGQVDPIEEARKIVQEEIKKLRDENAEKETQKKQNEDNRLVKEFKADITKTIKDNVEKFECCAFEGEEAELQAYHIILANLRENPNDPLMTIEEALEMTEDLYKEKYEKATKVIKKLNPTTGQVETSAAPVEIPAGSKVLSSPRGNNVGQPPVSQTPTAKPKTLTNSVAPTAAAASTTTTQRETPQQKKERLANLIREHGLKK